VTDAGHAFVRKAALRSFSAWAFGPPFPTRAARYALAEVLAVDEFDSG